MGYPYGQITFCFSRMMGISSSKPFYTKNHQPVVSITKDLFIVNVYFVVGCVISQNTYKGA